MEINIRKLQRQQIGVEKWRRKGGKGTLWYEMGVGKTYTAILIIQQLLKYTPDSTIILVVPSDLLRKQWTNEIEYHLKKETNQIKIYTSNEIIIGNLKLECNLLIIDEVHEFTNGNKRAIVSGHYIHYKFILGLTGTWTVADNSQMYLNPYCPVVDRIDEQEARESGFISTVIEYNLPIELTKLEQDKYNYYCNEITKFQKIFDNDFKLAVLSIKGENAKQIRTKVAELNGWREDLNKLDIAKREIIKNYNPSKIFEYAVDFVSVVQQRVRLVYKATNKIEPIVQLCKKYNVKTICFSESTEFADRIFYELNYRLKENDLLSNNLLQNDDVCSIYHSNIQTRVEIINGKERKIGKTILRKRAISNIDSGKTRILVTSSVLDRGLNVEDIRLGIVVSSTQDKNKHRQRNGRINRLEIYNPDVIVAMINIYAVNTVEETWLKNKQRGSKNLIKSVNSIEQINHQFEKGE